MPEDYYKKTETGTKYDRALLDKAEELISGQGDGRISLEDCQKLFDFVADANTYTDVEKATMRHIRENHKFTDAADAKFRHLIASWAAGRGWQTRKANEAENKGWKIEGQN